MKHEAPYRTESTKREIKFGDSFRQNARLRPARVAEEDDRGALNESFRSRGWLLTHGKVTLYEREER
jgi:hypothetical protein